MRLTIFGATGGTGRCLHEQVLGEGHEVTVVVRNPAGLSDQLRGRGRPETIKQAIGLAN
jgi:uncharacterized protein YbjT (DUF2867 family)